MPAGMLAFSSLPPVLDPQQGRLYKSMRSGPCAQCLSQPLKHEILLRR